VAGGCYHAISRGNNRLHVFHDEHDYAGFFGLLVSASRRVPVDLLAGCLMPNHFHVVVRSPGRHDLSRWMHWLLTTHTHRHHLRHESSGRVWQGRFKAFPIEADAHLLTVMRYVERNALRAGLVRRAEHWEWGSLAWRSEFAPTGLLSASPVPLPAGWTEFVNQPQTEPELEAIRACVNRQSPFGCDAWVAGTESGLVVERGRRPGRPRKATSNLDWVGEVTSAEAENP
jgi:putative transposase